MENQYYFQKMLTDGYVKNVKENLMEKYPKILYQNEYVKFVKYEIGIYGIEHKGVVHGNKEDE